jgi:hypothetical protein
MPFGAHGSRFRVYKGREEPPAWHVHELACVQRKQQTLNKL